MANNIKNGANGPSIKSIGLSFQQKSPRLTRYGRVGGFKRRHPSILSQIAGIYAGGMVITKGYNMEAKELAKLWANNRWVDEDWFNSYGKRQYETWDDFLTVRQAHWVNNDNREIVGTYDGYRLTACPVMNGWGYSIVTPWGASETIGVVDPNGRNDEAAIAKLHEIIALMPQAMEDVAKERANRPRAVADTAKATAKRAASPKAKQKDEGQPQDEPKPTPKLGRGRPKGSKDTKPRKRRTKAEINSETAPEEPKPTPRRSPTRTKAVKPRTKAQIIAETDRIIARIKAEKQKNGEVPAVEEKTPQKRPQAVRDTPKAQRDELGRVPLGDRGMSISGRYAYLTDGPRKYEARTVWTDGERDYVLEDKFFVPVPDGTLFSDLETTPAEVVRWRRQHHRS